MSDREFTRIERAPAYRLVYDAIEKDILAGRLRIGDPLPAETQLAEQFGVNRSTVREGIRLLEQSGLVEREGGRRPRISAPHYMDLASSASRALFLHSVTFRELWEASMLIEPAITEMAARNIKEPELLALRDNLAEMESAIKRIEAKETFDLDILVGLDRAFHEILANAAGNRVLTLAHEPITMLFIPAGRIILPKLGTYRRVLNAHRKITDCVEQHDAEGAREWGHKHMADFRRGYEMTGADFDAPLDPNRLGLS